MSEQQLVIISKKIFIEHSLKNVFKIFRNLELYPYIFDFLENVSYLDSSHFRWTANLSDQKEKTLWDVEITREIENELIEWHSAHNPDILHEGRIHLTNDNFRKGAHAEVLFRFFFPPMEDSESSMLGEDFENRVEDNLRRFKLAVEANEFPLKREIKNDLPEGFPRGEGRWKNFQ